MFTLSLLASLFSCNAGAFGASRELRDWTLNKQGEKTSYKVTVPCTVAGALNQAGYFGENVFDQDRYYKLDRKPFESPWVFTTSFKSQKGQKHILRFDGLNYYADIELNGKLIASADTTFGTFSVREFDVTALVKGNNKLKVTLRAAVAGDLNHGFVDWNPRPVDESMGITRPVTLITTPDVEVQDVFVKPYVDPADFSKADIEVITTLVNRSAKPVKGVLRAKWDDGGAFEKEVELAAGASKEISVRQTISNPRIWWTREMGKPEMYHIDVEFAKGKAVSHSKGADFGIRKIEGIIDGYGHRLFILNGKKVLIKAGGWTDDIFLQDTPESIKAQMDMVLDMGLNCIRFENIWGKDDYVYDLCDRMGILSMVGWSCQWEWKVYCGIPETRSYGCINTPETEKLAVRYFRDQLIRLRNHPSLIGWLTGSDRIPNERLERQYLALYEKLDYRAYVCSAAAMTSLAGPSGMKMEGPYEYVGPDYWYIDQVRGGAYGFNTETSPGLNLPQLESLRRMVGEEQLWPQGRNWALHCTTSSSCMNTTEFQIKSMEGLYGKADNLADYVYRAHAMDYNSERAMFEAFRCNLPRTTGIVQWMLNSAWPSIYWQLYDWYGIPTAGYYGVKKACKPIQLVYNYGDASVYVVNDAVPSATISAHMRVYDTQSRLIREESRTVTSLEREPLRVFSDIPGPCYVALEFTLDGKVEENFYCISGKNNVYDWKHADWWGIDILKYADLSFMCALPKASVKMDVRKVADGYDVVLTNKAECIAYQNILKALDGKGELIPGTFWEDNFLALLPGQTRTVHCTLPEGCAEARITLSGWNIKPVE
jgi:exo-1,4-beta-D-glucosaminidase